MRSYLLAKQMLIKAKRMTLNSTKKDVMHAAVLQIPRWLLHCAFLSLLVLLLLKGLAWNLILLLFLTAFVDALILPIIISVIRKEDGIRKGAIKGGKLFFESCLGISILFFCDYYILKHNPPVSAGVALMVGSLLLLLTILFFSYVTRKTIYNMELYDLYNISQVAYYSYFLGKIIRSILGFLFIPLVYDYLLEDQLTHLVSQVGEKNSEKTTITFHAINL